MNKNIQLVSVNKKAGLKKYFNDYLIELSLFDPTIKIDERGVPVYRWYDCYWTEKGRYPFLLNIDDQFAGLALVRELSPDNYEISEFYVKPAFRKNNNALDFAVKITRLLGGTFVFSARLNNVKAVKFWDKFAAKFPRGGSSVSDDRKQWFIQTENSANLV